MDNDDRALLLDSLGGIVRDQRHRLDEALTEFGWHDLLSEDPAAAVGILMELTGRQLAENRTLDVVALEVAGHSPDFGAVVFPMPGAVQPTSNIDHGDGADYSLVLRGVVLARPTPPTQVLVPARHGDRVVVASTSWRGAWPAEGTGIDPDSGFTPLDGVMPVDSSDLITGDAAAEIWRRLRAAAHRALAHYLVGVGATMLELATDHVMTRAQFGRPLASFQAVKHRLADVRLWQECARLAADAAWESLATPEEDLAATLAKSTANRFTRLAREHCQQVLGGMGFTWEHDFHRYARRALVIEPLFGSANQLQTMLGEAVRTEGQRPRLALL